MPNEVSLLKKKKKVVREKKGAQGPTKTLPTRAAKTKSKERSVPTLCSVTNPITRTNDAGSEDSPIRTVVAGSTSTTTSTTTHSTTTHLTATMSSLSGFSGSTMHVTPVEDDVATVECGPQSDVVDTPKQYRN